MNITKERLSKFATFLFVASYFFVTINIQGNEVNIPIHSIEMLIFPILYIFTLLMYRSISGFVPIIIMFIILALQCIYIIGFQSDPIFGDTFQYIVSFARLALFIFVITVYALLFYNEKLLMEYFWDIGKFVIPISIGAVVLYYIFGLSVLIDYPSIRLQGFFSEPSASAPFLASMFILSIKKREKFILFLVVGAIVLARSPTVLLTVLFSSFIVYILGKKVGMSQIIRAGILFSLIVLFVQIGGIDWLQNSSLFGQPVDRIISGFQSIQTKGDSGYNIRFTLAYEMVDTMTKYHLLGTGYGLNSAEVFFSDFTGQLNRDSSLLMTILFSYGIVGVILFVFVVLKSLRNMQKVETSYIYIFIPFMVASMINGAQGFLAYKFVIIGVIIYVSSKRAKTYNYLSSGS